MQKGKSTPTNNGHFVRVSKERNSELVLPGIALGGLGLITVMAYNDLSDEVFNKYFHHTMVTSRLVYCIVLTVILLLIIWIFKEKYGASTIDEDVMRYLG